VVERYITSGRKPCKSFTPAAKTNSDSSAEYTSGSGMPTRSSTSAMPFSASVALSAFSDENAIARPLPMSSPKPKSVRSLSFAVTTATLAPASWNAFMMVSARMKRASFIITSWPAAGS
jgi:hypothetical protein